jgi:alpha-amylase
MSLMLLGALGPAARCARAQDVSAPAILQDFENSYKTIEGRTADIFMAGYGTVYTPPPGRADSGNFSVGYDQYDRFDLGKPGNPTLYGTEAGLKAMVNSLHRMGGNSFIDLVWNHSGFSDSATPGFVAAGGYPGLNITLPNDVDGDYHSAFATGDVNMRLAGLVDIAQEKNYQMIRSPVDPNDPRNIRPGTTLAFGRLANVADPNNARFYPDTSLQPISVFDPTTGEQNIKIYPFNNANPLNGAPVPENALGYLMRNTQWLVQTVGVDGFRVDAAKNMPPWVLNYLDRAVYRSSFRTLLNGQQQQIFSFSEVFDGNQDFLQQFVRKDINPATPGVIGGNRDDYDFPLFFAIQSNLSGNGIQNDWRHVVGASFDLHDDGKMNGSQGVHFVSSQDNGPPALDSVAYAYTLMLPGNSMVYFNGKEFGNNRNFPQNGREDALGGAFGSAMTTLVDLRNRYGRGNYRQDFLEKENYAFERQGSALVMLSNRGDAGFDSRTIDVTFAPGTPLIELTGNAHSAVSDPHGDIPQLVVVNADAGSPTGASVNVRFLRNSTFDLNGQSRFTGNGYLIYGLASPQGALGLSNVSSVMAGHTPDPATSQNIQFDNGTTRLTDVNVVKANSFQVTLNTNKVNLLGTVRDHDADGDNAVIKVDGGLDVNGNGHVDFTDPNSVVYGFEQFTTFKSPGYFNASGNGQYTQTIEATQLADGYHYVDVRAFRHRADGGPAIFTDFKSVIYVDRNKPTSAIDSFDPIAANVSANRQLVVRSTDQTADSVHTFLNLPAGLSDQQILAIVNDSNHAGQVDRDLFSLGYNNVPSGNEVFTVVTYRPTGNYNVQRFAGNLVQTTRGRGLGDTNFDGAFAPADVTAFEMVLYSQNQQFNPAADINGDGKVDNNDLYLLPMTLTNGGASAATLQEAHGALLRRGDLNQDGHSDAADIDTLYRNLGSTAWLYDLNSTGAADQASVDTLVHTIFGTHFGDTNLDGVVNAADVQQIIADGKYNTGLPATWAQGDFNGDGIADFGDIVKLLGGGGYTNAPAAAALEAEFAAIPEPSFAGVLLLAVAAMRCRRGRRSRG